MRTLLTDILPPQCVAPNKIVRTFPQSAVLTSESHLTEVGVVGTVIAAPSELPVGEAGAALERGVALSPEAKPAV